ncbi:hypothetical protein QMU85_002634 [Photobacterium damselae]|nr:hypothetical protein [Photobacterium damselae]
MFSVLFRSFILMLCLGLTSVAHADARTKFERDFYHLSVNANQLVIEDTNSSFDIATLYRQIHIDETVASYPFARQDKLIWNFANQAEEESHGDHQSRESHDIRLGLANSSRFLSMAHHDPDEVQPLYYLAHEISVPSILSIAKSYSEDLCPTLDWILKIKPSSNRISGWKESNLTYRIYSHQYLA